MVWRPLGTTIEFQVKLVPDDDAISALSMRKSIRLTFDFTLTEVTTKLATIASGFGAENFIGVAYARLSPSRTRIKPTNATIVILSRPRAIRVAISPPRPHHKQPATRWCQ